MYFDSRDITDFYQRALFPDDAGAQPEQLGAAARRQHLVGGVRPGQLQDRPTLTLTAGGRVTEDKKTTQLLKTADTADRRRPIPHRPPLRAPVGHAAELGLSARCTRSTPMSASMPASPRGFRGPTIQGRSAVFNTDFTTANSETILSWEAGFKTSCSTTRCA